jgi:23S rRNA pseudouridine1911/1915/1917 synthase
MSPEPIDILLNAPGERIDRALAAARPDISRMRWQKLIKDGHVTLHGQPVKSSLRLEGKETVSVTIPELKDTTLRPEPMDLDIRYEDRDLLVVNKPAGLVVHPAPGHSSGTLVNGLLAYCPDLAGVGGFRRPGIVHRLDKDTSGLIVIAKHDQSLMRLQDQFRERTVEKTYLALVEGHIHPAEAVIDAPIGRDPRQRKKMAVIPPGGSATARPAQTSYRALTFFDGFTLVACNPRTGRTHQIRVHMAFAGHPIVGDTIYGRRKQRLRLQRHFLHAAGLIFRRMDGRKMNITAELPPDLQQVIDELQTAG